MLLPFLAIKVLPRVSLHSTLILVFHILVILRVQTIASSYISM
nr:MAG TPA: hypothetical protein [Bacteriophage sp.]DAT50646.1 MAG TPA: hypothetical protein [Bacteriophage sp.]DAX07155.1 MAG TPA: hypothetical protein [Bacteriophage sp.]